MEMKRYKAVDGSNEPVIVEGKGSWAPQYKTKSKMRLYQTGTKSHEHCECPPFKTHPRKCFCKVPRWKVGVIPGERRASRENGANEYLHSERPHRGYGESTIKYQVSSKSVSAVCNDKSCLKARSRRMLGWSTKLSISTSLLNCNKKSG